MATFTAPTPLTRQITAALKVLRTARFDNDDVAICIAERRLDRLLDRYADTTERKGRSSL